MEAGARRVRLSAAALLLSLMAVPRAQSPDADYIASIVDTVRSASAIKAVTFTAPCWICRERNVRARDVAKHVRSVALSGAAAKECRELLLKKDAFIPTLTKPCPFIADRGVELDLHGRRVYLVISARCQTARLVAADRSSGVVNIDPIAGRLIELLNSATRAK
jgi:hypothetical protein